MSTPEPGPIFDLTPPGAKPQRPAGTSWPVRGGTFAGPFRIDNATCTLLPGESRVDIAEAGVTVEGKYDPPGSWLYALLATIVSGVAAAVMVSAFGYGAFIGWLVWYVLIVAVRRKRVALHLSEAHEIVIDPEHSRIGFLMDFRGRRRWFAIQLSTGFDRVRDALRTLPSERLRENAIQNASAQSAILLIGLILAAVAATAFFLLTAQR